MDFHASLFRMVTSGGWILVIVCQSGSHNPDAGIPIYGIFLYQLLRFL